MDNDDADANTLPPLGLRCAWCGTVLRESPKPEDPLAWSDGICADCQKAVIPD